MEKQVALEDLGVTFDSIWSLFTDIEKIRNGGRVAMNTLPKHEYSLVVEVSHISEITVHATNEEDAISLAIEQAYAAIPKGVVDPFCMSTKLDDCVNLSIQVLESERS